MNFAYPMSKLAADTAQQYVPGTGPTEPIPGVGVQVGQVNDEKLKLIRDALTRLFTKQVEKMGQVNNPGLRQLGSVFQAPTPLEYVSTYLQNLKNKSESQKPAEDLGSLVTTPYAAKLMKLFGGG